MRRKRLTFSSSRSTCLPCVPKQLHSERTANMTETVTVTGELPARSAVHREDTWDLSTIYADTAAWEADFNKVGEALPKIAAFKGTLHTSAKHLLDALTLKGEIAGIAGKLYVYAHMRSDQELTNT